MYCRKPIIPLLSILLIFSCKSPHQQIKAEAVPVKTDSIPVSQEDMEKAAAVQEKWIEDTLGRKISTFEFRVKAGKDEQDISEDGLIPWISLDSPEKKIKGLIDPNEVVIPCQKVTVMIDYPLAKPVFFHLTGDTKGFTRRQLLLELSKKYHEIYDEEERTATTKTTPMDERKTMNRNETNGKYGIWGHDLADLVLTSITVRRNDEGEIFLELGIDS